MWICGKPGFDPWVGKIPWRRERLPIPVFWPGEFHGQRSLAGYSPTGCKELDMTEQLSLSLYANIEINKQKKNFKVLPLSCLPTELFFSMHRHAVRFLVLSPFCFQRLPNLFAQFYSLFKFFIYLIFKLLFIF